MNQALMIFLFIFGAVFGRYISQMEPAVTSIQASTDPVRFQKNDCSSTSCRFETTPKTMLLKFVPQDEFDRAVSNADGYANISRQPCEIVIPVGQIIESKPDLGEAKWFFKSYRMNQVLAHEILHCYVGRWHPDQGALAMNILREQRDQERDRLASSYRYRVPRLPAQNYELNKWQ